jgi:D-alanyl-D-alanine carboxypeptidase
VATEVGQDGQDPAVAAVVDRQAEFEELAEMQDTLPVGEEIQAFWPDAGYGLGLVSRPLSCGGRYWSHEGGESGFITLNGATEDGGRVVTVSMSTALGDDILRQEQSASALVDRALCGIPTEEQDE